MNLLHLFLLVISAIALCISVYKKLHWIICLFIFIGFCVAVYWFFFSKRESFEFRFTDDIAYIQRGQVDVYCGDSLILPDDYDVMGTRNQCLKKGIGVGMGMSDQQVNEIIAKPPRVQTERLYCGNNEALSEGYTRFGTNYECMKIGVGVGARMPEEKRRAFRWKPPKNLSKREIYQLAHRFKIDTNQTRAAVLRQIGERMI